MLAAFRYLYISTLEYTLPPTEWIGQVKNRVHLQVDAPVKYYICPQLGYVDEVLEDIGGTPRF